MDERHRKNIGQVYAAMPDGGLFSGGTWRSSPTALPLSEEQVQEMEDLGPRLLKFYKAADQLYVNSARGKQPEYVKRYLENGKPPTLMEAAQDKAFRDTVPQVIRPDIMLTEDGFAITELDSVPGGIGTTAWLNETYAALGEDVVGGPRGMLEGFASIFSDSGGKAQVLIAEESRDYRPEMEWLTRRINHDDKLTVELTVRSAEEADRDWSRVVYRFFELFDLPNIPASEAILQAACSGAIRVTPPFKPHLEEKLQLALLWSRPLRPFWEMVLGRRYLQDLQTVVPRSWVLDPEPVPYHAVIPGLDIQGWDEMKDFSQRERQLVLKISGFDETAWGARSVVIGQDVPQEEWAAAIDEALEHFEQGPYVLQDFHRAKVIEHIYHDPESDEFVSMAGRVRLSPYYFVPDPSGKETRLGGVLCTIVPENKKVIHGMSEAIVVPARLA